MKLKAHKISMLNPFLLFVANLNSYLRANVSFMSTFKRLNSAQGLDLTGDLTSKANLARTTKIILRKRSNLISSYLTYLIIAINIPCPMAKQSHENRRFIDFH